eukprot:760130-Hanusia_phi.AAC.1
MKPSPFHRLRLFCVDLGGVPAPLLSALHELEEMMHKDSSSYAGSSIGMSNPFFCCRTLVMSTCALSQATAPPELAPPQAEAELQEIIRYAWEEEERREADQVQTCPAKAFPIIALKVP